MKDKQLAKLSEWIGTEKTYLNNGYYRIRDNKFGQKEIAFLAPCSCGTTSVSPQITLERKNDNWEAIKLMDMGASPTIFLTRDPENEAIIDEALEDLLVKMEEAIASEN